MFRPSCDSIIFDLDGTLWDASAASAMAWSKVASELELKVSVDEAAIKNVSGLPFDKCVDALFGDCAQKIPNLRSLLDKAEQDEILNRGGRFYEGMVEGLRKLRKEYKLFLVSNCQEWYLNAFFEHSGLQDLFQDSLCYGQTNRSKAENIKEIVRRNNLKKRLYVGDTHWDQEAAFYSGSKFIFAKFGFGSVQVSCPAVSSISELVDLMTAPKEVPDIEVRKLSSKEFELASRFYKSVGYEQGIQRQDKFFAAFHNNSMVGLVRLASENENWVLRGMQIKPSYQFFGIGSKLVRLLEREIGPQQCFCLPHGWLDKFYGQSGFQKVESLEEVPQFLVDRFLENKKKYPQLILMRRSP
jgi:phosphoglycolate phosphatase